MNRKESNSIDATYPLNVYLQIIEKYVQNVITGLDMCKVRCVASSDGERLVGKTEAPDPAQKHKQTEQKNRPVAV